jgi:hypothetical protein
MCLCTTIAGCLPAPDQLAPGIIENIKARLENFK